MFASSLEIMGSGASIPLNDQELSPRSFSGEEIPIMGLRLNSWPQLVEACGGKESLRGLSTYEVCENFIKPYTKHSGLSYCEQLRRAMRHDAVATANVYVVHAWQNDFLELIEAIQHHFSDDADVVIWLDVFSINQHRPFDIKDKHWSQAFQVAFHSIQRVILVVDSWDATSLPIPLQRTWCLFEIYNAIVASCILEVAFMPLFRQKVYEDLQKDAVSMIKQLATVNCNASQSSEKREKDQLLNDLQNYISLTAVNNIIFLRIKQWMVDELRKISTSEAITNTLQQAMILISLGNLQLMDAEEDSLLVDQAAIEFKVSCDLRMALLGSDHPLTWSSKQRVAYCFLLQRNLYEAEEILQDCYERQKERFGADHLDTIESAHVLAKIYQALQYDADAEPLYVDCLERRRRLLGDDHFETQKLKSDVASFYLLYHRYDDAVQLFETVYQQRQKQLGDDHLDTITAMVNLASVYNKVKHDKTEELLMKCYEKRKMVYGMHHHRTLSSMINLGMYYQEVEAYDKAEDCYRKCIDIGDGNVGCSTAAVIVAKSNLALLLAHTGRVQEAIDMFLSNYRYVIQSDSDGTFAVNIIKNLQLLLQREGRSNDIDELLLSCTKLISTNGDAEVSKISTDKARTVSWENGYSM